LRNFVQAAAFCAAGLLLVGCASGPTFAQLHASEPAVANDSARIYFYREASMVGSALQPGIYVNAEKVGSAVPGGYFYVDRPAGDYDITTTTEKTETVHTTLKPGDTRYVRFDIGLGVFVGHVIPSLVLPEQGATEIIKCHYLVDKPKNSTDKKPLGG
jgi:hypothetical protein